MGAWIATFFATAVAFLGCDAVWLSLTASRLYRPRLAPLMADNFAMAPAAIFYLLYIAGILFFAVAPALASGRWQAATLRGVLFGLVAYATYDLTNQATLKGWPVVITLADLAWGMFVTGAAATVGLLVARRLGAAG